MNRCNLASMLESVAAGHEPVVITRDNGKPAAVLMPLGDFASFEETKYLPHSPGNAKRLLGSIAELESGKGHAKELQGVSDDPPAG